METDNKLPETIKREELFAMLWKEPATKLAAQFQIPYPEFKKICDSLSIPLPGSGYWSKLRAGKPVPEAILPADYSGPLEVVIEPKVIEKRAKSLPTLPEGCDTGSEKIIKVSAKLVNPDPLIVAVKAKLENPKYLHDGLAWPGSEYVSIKVSPKNVSRALRFMDALIKSLISKGHTVAIEYSTTYAVIEGQKIEISLREKLNKSIEKGSHWNSARYTPSGILVFKMDRVWAKEWRDGKFTIEEYLPDIITRLEKKGIEEKEQQIRWKKEAEEQRERERVQRELEARQEKELAGFKSLLQDAKRWKEVKILREYIADMKSNSTFKNNHAEAHEAWIKWAEEKADWYDPQINLADELMNNVDKETLALKKKYIYHGW